MTTKTRIEFETTLLYKRPDGSEVWHCLATMVVTSRWAAQGDEQVTEDTWNLVATGRSPEVAREACEVKVAAALLESDLEGS